MHEDRLDVAHRLLTQAVDVLGEVASTAGDAELPVPHDPAGGRPRVTVTAPVGAVVDCRAGRPVG